MMVPNTRHEEGAAAGAAGMPASPAFALQHVTKSFAGRVVLDLPSLQIAPGRIRALIGQNGSGKSTLIKVLAGFHEPDPREGLSIEVAGVDVSARGQDLARRSGIRFVHQDLALVGQMSVLDNLYLGRPYPTRGFTVRARTARANAREALTRVGLGGLDVTRRTATLSPAERTGVAIARALATDAGDEPSVLVLDEPTATLPAPEVVELLRNLRRVASTGVAILYVTHHLDEVFRIADDVSVLRDGALVASGPTQTFTHRQLVHHLVGSELEAIRAPDRPSDGHQAGRKDMRLVVEDLVADGVNGMSFTVAPGEIVGIYGVTGSGRDAVLGAVFGARGREAGQVQVAGSNVPARQPHHSIRLGVGYVPANRRTHGAVIEMSAAENLTLPALSSFWRRGRLDVPGEKRDADTWFSKLEVRPANGTQLPLASFSGGNQQKVVLAKWLRQDPCLLLLDEPTQGVDIGAKAVIHRAILAAVDDGLSVVIASSDDEEVASLCSRVHVVQHGRIVDTVVGADITEAELRRRLNTAHRPTLTTDGDQ